MTQDTVDPRMENRRRERRISLGHSCVMAFVFVAHVMLFGYLLLPVAPMLWWAPRPKSIADSLQVRFVPSITKERASPAASATRRSKFHQSGMGKRRSKKVPALQESGAVQVPVATSPVRLVTRSASLELAAPKPSGADYIPGGSAFRQGGEARFGKQNIRIPGDSFVSHAPRFRMVDPRTQGLGGVVRAIGSMFGAVDSHCLDLDAWQGMTPAERIAHHLSSDVMQKIADQYHCQAPRQRPNDVR